MCFKTIPFIILMFKNILLLCFAFACFCLNEPTVVMSLFLMVREHYSYFIYLNFKLNCNAARSVFMNLILHYNFQQEISFLNKKN